MVVVCYLLISGFYRDALRCCSRTPHRYFSVRPGRQSQLASGSAHLIFELLAASNASGIEVSACVHTKGVITSLQTVGSCIGGS